MTRNKLSQHSSEIEEILSSSKHSKELTQKKIIGDMLYKCDQLLSSKLADFLLSNEEIDLNNPDIQDIITINKDQFAQSSSDITLSDKQVDLIDRIVKESQKTDDGFDQEPPIVKGFDAEVYAMSKAILPPWLYNGGLVGGVVLIGGLAYSSNNYVVVKKVNSLGDGKKLAEAKKKTKKEKKDQ